MFFSIPENRPVHSLRIYLTWEALNSSCSSMHSCSFTKKYMCTSAYMEFYLPNLGHIEFFMFRFVCRCIFGQCPSPSEWVLSTQLGTHWILQPFPSPHTHHPPHGAGCESVFRSCISSYKTLDKTMTNTHFKWSVSKIIPHVLQNTWALFVWVLKTLTRSPINFSISISLHSIHF